MNDNEKLVIFGTHEDGSRLRPHDWVERISSMVAEFGPDHRLHYSENAHPAVIDGQRCLVVDGRLRKDVPQLYDYIISFARRNRLSVQGLRGEIEVGEQMKEPRAPGC